jgi:hypothetical protein
MAFQIILTSKTDSCPVTTLKNSGQPRLHICTKYKHLAHLHVNTLSNFLPLTIVFSITVEHSKTHLWGWT